MKNSDLWLPPPTLTISEWADTYRCLSSEASAEPGRWNTDRAPYQRDMMDAVKNCERIVIMTAAQVGKSELLLNTIGYYASQDPSPILMLQPTLEMGEAFSKDRLAPMIRDTPILTGIFPDPKTRASGNTLLHKVFPGGQITIAGANSPAGLASRPIRILLCDEVDRYPPSAGSEGDPLSLAMKRTANFWNRRIVWVSTPTLKGISRIEKAYQLSTCEEWLIPCPKCGELQPYSWERMIYHERTEPVMRCNHCGQEFSEAEWKKGHGEWHSQLPPEEQSTALMRGFHMNAFASPWASWKSLIASYHEAKSSGEEMLIVWTNTVLGEPYEVKEGTIDVDIVSRRCEDYGAEVPEGVQVLTCGVDVQDDRLELEVVGWSAHYESWGIAYQVLHGSPGSSEVWDVLDEYLSQEWHKADGSSLVIACTCIDSGGHFTDNVYRFVQGKSRQRIFAIVGRGNLGHPCVSGPTRTNRRRIPLFTLGVGTIKGILFSRLQAEEGETGYCHFPKGAKAGYDVVYFHGLLSERMILKRKNGRDMITWEKRKDNARNEPLDCRVYAIGAYEILNPKLAPKVEAKKSTEKSAEKPSQRAVKMRRPLIRRRLTW